MNTLLTLPSSPTILLMILLLALIIQTSFAVTADYNIATSTAFQDSSNTTCDWSTGLGLIRSPLGVNGSAIDLGDGSDGDCDFQGSLPARTYQCLSLTINTSTTFTGSDPVIIRVQGEATINATVAVNGSDGINGTTQSSADTTISGGTPGSGGFSGGGFQIAGLVATSNNGNDNGNGAGVAGGAALTFNAVTDDGGGGGGGSYGEPTQGQAGAAGAGDDIPGSGGAAGSFNTADDQDTFDTSANLIGGSGGGAGGAGDNQSGFFFPGTGGGGGGVIQISAGGNLSIGISGKIEANGGNGGNGFQAGAGGGGGSGGTIFLQSGEDIIIDGAIEAIGGNGGNGGQDGAGANAEGGDGGDGRIRLDDGDGAITGAGSVTPSARLDNSSAGIYDVGFDTNPCIAQSIGLDTRGVRNSFSSFTTQTILNGGTITTELSESDDNQSFSAWIPLNNYATLSKRYIRFRSTLTPFDATTSSELQSIQMSYTIEDKSDYVFESDVSCANIQTEKENHFSFLLLFFFSFIIGRKLKLRPKT